MNLDKRLAALEARSDAKISIITVKIPYNADPAIEDAAIDEKLAELGVRRDQVKLVVALRQFSKSDFEAGRDTPKSPDKAGN